MEENLFFYYIKKYSSYPLPVFQPKNKTKDKITDQSSILYNRNKNYKIYAYILKNTKT